MAGSWKSLARNPTFNASTMLLLTDASVLCHDAGADAGGTPHWWRLFPDSNGDYSNGTWTQAKDGPNAPLFFASAVLRDGTVFVAGGEYNAGNQVDLLAAEIYDPVADDWTTISTPPGWNHVGDAPSCVLSDGRLLLGSIDAPTASIYDPTSRSWSPTGAKEDACDEETFTLLRDGTVLVVDCNNGRNAERYAPASNSWVSAGSTPTSLTQICKDGDPGEIGPAILLYDGRVFAIGASGATAIYSLATGAWSAGPNMRAADGSTLYPMDAPACLLTNGRVLCAGSPGDPCAYPGPTFFFEYDPATNALSLIPSPSNGDRAVYYGRMLLLPTGEVLFSNGSTNMQMYVSDGVPSAAWRPTISSLSVVGGEVLIRGTQFNGLSQAVSYGDDAQMATNYPLCRIAASDGSIYYARTHDHSTMAVATGSMLVSTSASLSGVPSGNAHACIVANGIASASVGFIVP